MASHWPVDAHDQSEVYKRPPRHPGAAPPALLGLGLLTALALCSSESAYAASCALCRASEGLGLPSFLPAVAGGLAAGALTLFFPPDDPGTFHPFPGDDHQADHNAEDTGDTTAQGTRIPHTEAGPLQTVSDWVKSVTESVMGTDPEVARPMTRS
jgi:hypothetical protein